ncbi:MAG: diguanylate cyclase [Anaerolineae bacterium]|jgi:diguanylate cyclase (GGDEF)-like protein/PAS domain S-box-containing protein|nr:diguanylate cyclase [Anaerolineae bacterium]MBT7072504.1 diguanylate cyclase [Anaerolineae bacterium]MBT7989745.1 diguanylate cyclase [Anaerolineae bacterium]
MDQYYFFVVLAPTAAFITIAAAIYAWRRRLVPGAVMLMLDLLCITGWLLSNTGELIGSTENISLSSVKITYLFITTAPIFWIGFALQYTGKVRWLSFSRFAFFWVFPIITFTLVQTNEWHGMIWDVWKIEAVNDHLQLLKVTLYGPWFWVNVVYSYALMFSGAFLLIQQHIRSAPIYRKQSNWLVAGALAPLIFNYIYITKLIPGLQKDFSPIAFAFSGIAFAIGIFRYDLLDLMPIARNTIVENMQEGMLVIDHKTRLLDINPAARKLLLPTKDSIIGKPIEKYLPEIKPLLPKDDQGSRALEFSLRRNRIIRNFEGKLSILRDRNKKRLGYLLVLQDITERKKLHDEVERLASKDSLTGLHNRRHLLELAQQELHRSYRYKHTISLLVIDIDHFKNINDTYGHLVGDQVLINFANFLQKMLRIVDIIGRFGGDEFVVILPETDFETTIKTANRLCDTIRKTPFATKKGNVFFTLSIGISSENDVKKDTDLYAFLEHADRALYHAKSLGRDQVASEK